MDDILDEAFTDIFPQQGNIFKAEAVLRKDYVPKVLVARDKEIKEVAFNISPILRSGEPSNMYIWGDTGTGKTITIKYVLNVLTSGIKKQGKNILVDSVILDCTSVKNETMACTEILGKLTGVMVKQGLQFNQYLKEIWNFIDTTAERYAFYTLVMVFDEVDKFNDPDNILYQLSRALAHQKVSNNNIAIEIILASNQKDFLQKLDAKVLSSSSFHYCNFPDYNENEIYQILQSRREAFIESAISDEVFHYCAKKIADKYHGDSRLALAIIYEAGKIALAEDASIITIEHVDAGEDAINVRATTEMLQKISAHDKFLIVSIYLANNALRNVRGKLLPHTGVITEIYNKICELVDDSPNTETHISHRLGVLSDKQLIRKREIRGYGNTGFFEMSEDVNKVMELLYTPMIKAIVEKNYADIESIAISNAKSVHKKAVDSNVLNKY